MNRLTPFRSARRPMLTVLLAAALFPVPVAMADGGIKLITLPIRERVEIQLDHSSLTLVEEERIVPLAKGVNDVIFAWANTSIDKDAIQFRCLTDPEQIKVISVSYPPGQNALTWQVSSPEAASARVRISYLVGQLSKSYSYRAVASADEKNLNLWQYLELHNQAPEDFGVAGMWPGFGERLERPISGGETKRLLAGKFRDLPVVKTYTADLAQFGYSDAGKRQLQIPMHYVIRNREADGLGAYPLQPGKARIFQQDSRGTQAFLGENWAPYTPRDDEMRLALGTARDIVVIRTIERRDREKVHGQLFDLDVVVKYEIENFKDQPVVLDIAEYLPALRGELGLGNNRPIEWVLEGDSTLGEQDTDESNADRPVFHVSLPARGDDQKAVKVVHKLHLVNKNEW